MKVLALICILMVAHTTVSLAQVSPVISLPESADGCVSLDITLLANSQILSHELLSVYVQGQQSDYEGMIAIQGDYEVEENSITFKPLFPFDQGLPYEVRFKDGNTDTFKTVPFQIGQNARVPSAQLLDIYPSSTFLPENILRFYLYFQTPMKQDEALMHIELIDEDGNTDDHAFMTFKEELWSTDGRRLTLLFDPGRIKRGVSTNMAMGPALVQDKVYHLKVSDNWRDVHGHQLPKIYKKELQVVKAYRTRMKVELWSIHSPNSDSPDPLIIQTDRILDHALIHSMIHVRDDTGELIEGEWAAKNAEQLLQFVPTKRWKRGLYIIDFDSRLEDVAGNNLQNLLDHRTEEKEVIADHHTINFIIK